MPVQRGPERVRESQRESERRKGRESEREAVYVGRRRHHQGVELREVGALVCAIVALHSDGDRLVQVDRGMQEPYSAATVRD